VAYPKSGRDRFLPQHSCQHTVPSTLHTSLNSGKVSKWIEDTVHGVETIHVPQKWVQALVNTVTILPVSYSRGISWQPGQLISPHKRLCRAPTNHEGMWWANILSQSAPQNYEQVGCGWQRE